VLFVPETSVNVTEQLQKIGQTAQDYRDAIVSQFKDMEVEVKKLELLSWENGKRVYGRNKLKAWH
jgi:hypothetical protein